MEGIDRVTLVERCAMMDPRVSNYHENVFKPNVKPNQLFAALVCEFFQFFKLAQLRAFSGSYASAALALITPPATAALISLCLTYPFSRKPRPFWPLDHYLHLLPLQASPLALFGLDCIPLNE